MSGGLFGVGSGEIILILLIILLVMGPDRLPQVAHAWGKLLRFVTKFSNTWNRMNTQLMRQVDEETKPLRAAVQLDVAAEPDPSTQVAPQDPDPNPNTIAPPEFAGQPDPAVQPPTAEAEAVPAPEATPGAEETSDGG